MIVRSPYGAPLASATSQPTLTALKAMPVTDHVPYELVTLSDGRVVYYHPTSVLTADNLFIFDPSTILVGGTPTAQPGKFLLAAGPTVLVLPITYATTDASSICTIPTGAELKVNELLWNVTTSFTGGTTPSIGIAASITGYSTEGDLLGGATGDVAATLVSTGAKYKAGTVGAQFATLTLRDGCVLVAADYIKYDRITNPTTPFSAGAGNVIVKARVLVNAGA
jgi:hypothetical protein